MANHTGFLSPPSVGRGKKIIYSCSGCGEFIISVSVLSSTLVFSLPLPMVEFQMQGFTFISHCLSPYLFFFFLHQMKKFECLLYAKSCP